MDQFFLSRDPWTHWPDLLCCLPAVYPHAPLAHRARSVADRARRFQRRVYCSMAAICACVDVYLALRKRMPAHAGHGGHCDVTHLSGRSSLEDSVAEDPVGTSDGGCVLRCRLAA